jgi:hypothetical protein
MVWSFDDYHGNMAVQQSGPIIAQTLLPHLIFLDVD